MIHNRSGRETNPRPQTGLRTYVLVAWAILATLIAQQQRGAIQQLRYELGDALALAGDAINEARAANQMALDCYEGQDRQRPVIIPMRSTLRQAVSR